MRAEFEAVIVALAEAYGAGKKDVVEAARQLPYTRRGPKEKNDDAIMREMRQAIGSKSRKTWSIAREFAERIGGHSQDSTARRLYRKVKTPLRVPRWLPTGEPDASDALPFTLALEAIAEVSRVSRQRQVNRLIARRLNTNRPN